MAYDKSQIHTLAENVINGRIDELSARESVPEELKKILEIEINKRLMARGYDRNNIQNTTDRGIPLLANDIVVGLVDENKAMNGIFKGYLPKLKEEIAKRREDEILWNEAVSSQEIEMFKKYLDTYDNHDSSYEGRYVARAKEYIRNIEDDEKEWLRAKNANKEEVYLHYLEIYDQPKPSYQGKYVADAQSAILKLNDETDWLHAANLNTTDSYNTYLSKYDRVPPEYRGVHVENAKQAIKSLTPSPTSPPVPTPPPVNDPNTEDDKTWDKAVRLNTVEAYKDYLSLYCNGIHKKEAQDAIDKIEKAKRKVVGLTPHPVPPKPLWRIWVCFAVILTLGKFVCWRKWVFLAVILILGIFAYIQYQNGSWPFNSNSIGGENKPITQMEQIDSLQWAIDNHDIPMLTRYAELDSTRAYYPLALALNSQDSASNINKTLHWLDLVLDPDTHSLHQNIINDIQEKELNQIESRFYSINPNAQDADWKYLDIYKDYISHFERLASHVPRIITVQFIPIEKMAETQIKDRRKHEVLRTSILREWENQHARLESVLAEISENAKKAYLKSK